MTNVELTLGCARFLAGILAEKVESGTFTSDHAQQAYAGRLTELQEAIARASTETPISQEEKA